jgi:uncharacterized protein YdaU (DUF1376 family)
MAAPPWMPLYVADYLADTRHLNAAEHGAYLLLLMHQWQHGYVPDDQRALARIACALPHQWPKIWNGLRSFFRSQAVGKLENKRLAMEIARQAEISNKRKDAALQMHSNRRAKAPDLHPSLHDDLHTHPHPHPHPPSPFGREGGGRHDGPRANGSKPTAGDRARRLAEQVAARERAGSDGRPADVAQMLDQFPAGSQREPDPEGYIPALAAVLANHPREVAEDCANPRLGVVKDCIMRHALTPGRVNEWCTRQAADLVEFVKRDDERLHAAAEAKRLKDEQAAMDRAARPTLDAMRAKYGPNWGLQPMFDPVDAARGKHTETEEERKARRADQQREIFDRASKAITADYARAGLEPVTVSGIPVSRELAGIMGKVPKRIGADEAEEAAECQTSAI